MLLCKDSRPLGCLFKFQQKALLFVFWIYNMYAPSLVSSIFCGEREADRSSNELEKSRWKKWKLQSCLKRIIFFKPKIALSPSGDTSFSERHWADLNTDRELGIFPLLQRQRQYWHIHQTIDTVHTSFHKWKTLAQIYNVNMIMTL